METKIYSLFDGPATAFTQPMFFHTDGQAIRAVAASVNSQEENHISRTPADFTLFQLGTYDDKTGVIQSLSTPKRIALAVELVEDNKKQYSNVDLEKLMEEIKNLPALLKKQAE